MTRSRIIAAALAASLAAGIAAAEETGGVAPSLGAASGFQFGPQARVLAGVDAQGIADLRDGVVWGEAETAPGTFRWDRGSLAQAGTLAARGRLGSLTLYPQAPGHEDGATVTTDAGIAAFADFAAALALRFPDLPAIEIANEFNGAAFVTGPARAMTPLERADLHARHLAALAARPALRDRRILGGAAHSVAAGYLWRLLDQGAAAHMDAVTVHPYTSAPEEITAQLEVLRRHPDMAGLDVEVTEFGARDADTAADFFWRSYCAMAEAGVSRAVWYPLESRGDGYVALMRRDGSLTAPGAAFLHAQAALAGRPVRSLRPDPFLRGCLFGDDLLVLWGAPRRVTLQGDGLEALDAALSPLVTTSPRLSPDRVLILRATDGALDPARDIAFGPSDLLADSFYQFTYPEAGSDAGDGAVPGFARVLEVGGRRLALTTCPGQERPGTPWTPYLCSDRILRFVLQADGFTLGGNGETPVHLVHRFTLEAAAAITVEAELALAAASRNGVGVALRVAGQTRDRRVLRGGAETLRFDAGEVAAGASVELVIDPDGDPVGDAGRLVIRVRDAAGAGGTR